MNEIEKYQRFQNLDFEGFRKLAQDTSLSRYEKIGFPDSYRKHYESAIFTDIRQKLTRLDSPGQTVLDIGSGCSDLPHMLIELCQRNNHQLILVDSQEMLDMLPDAPFITKIAGAFPTGTPQLISDYAEQIDAILVYSVLHYVFAESNIFDFLDQSLSLLRLSGQLLIGDIPNVSKRKRFFSSKTGIAYHKQFMQTDDLPEIDHIGLEQGKIDDSVLFGLMLRCRSAGFESYLLPQDSALPMANRREDMLVIRP